MATNYDGLTRNVWPGTWSTGTNAPIVLDTEVRGTLQSISGASGDQLHDIPGARIQEGMLVYVKNGYTNGSTTYTADKYYTYKLQGSEVRSSITGAVPNADANWTLFSVGGGIGYTGSAGAIGFTGSVGALGYSGSKGDLGYSGSVGADGSDGSDGAIGYSGSKGDLGYSGSKGDQGVIGYSGSKGDQGVIGYAGSEGVGYTGSQGTQGIVGYVGSEGNLDVTVNSTPPVGAGIGDVWIDDATGIQYFWMYDGNSNQWVELSNQGVVGFTGSQGTVGAINDLSDVTVTSPSRGQTLVYETAGWIQSVTPISQFVVTANGSSAYRFNGAGFPAGTSGDNPTIFLKKGQTYYFRNTSSGHPFEIRSSAGGSAYTTGVTDNNASGPSGIIVFHVPMNSPATLYYQCSSHSSMLGTITIV
tara:strand:- start:202 stop:1449 length:1248 start_codon:yes stop_codon:yes gene_type:complete